jgi:peptide/nickel transport system permease protein
LTTDLTTTPPSEPAYLAARPSRFRRFLPSFGFLRFLAQRFVAMILLLLGITVIVWGLTALVPGDPAAIALGDPASSDPVLVHAYHVRYGLDKPLPVQYAIYMRHLLQGDLGTSVTTRRPVMDDLRQFVPATAELAVLACLFGFTIGIALGTWAALRRDGITDHSLRFFSLAGLSAPGFWLALIVLYFFFFKWGLAPGGGRLGPGVTPPPGPTGSYVVDSIIHGQWSTLWDALRHMMLPSFVLILVVVGYITRYTRSAVLEVASEDFVRAARAKGLPERTVITRYILRAAAPSVITVLGLAFAFILAGSVFIESVYTYGGLGQYAFTASITLDHPAITGVTLFIASVYIVINFIVDILYGLIDPRIRVT